MNGWTPKPWIVPLPEWNPESLPGYAEAKAKVERGEPLFAKQPARAIAPTRMRRSVESLVVERDRLLARRLRLGVAALADDPGALSGIRRKPNGIDRRQAARSDRELELFAKLSEQIRDLDGRIVRGGAA